jgi:hypothetical protein
MRESAVILGSAIQCYSQRLLNPFRGVVNIIRYKSAEAVTSDGIHWDIYVSNDSLLDGLDKSRSIQISDIRYGRWSEREGLIRGPVYPSDEFYTLEAMGAVVYQHLLKAHTRVPFPFNDSFELWLLDETGRPLALLNSAVDETSIDDYQLLDWRAGQLCRQSFSFPSMERTGAGAYDCVADHLIEYINSCASTPPAAQWFERKQGGSARAMHGHNIDDSLRGRMLDAEDFPEYFISTRHGDDDCSRLVNGFIEWQSPWLLLLNTLTSGQRQYFEQCARKQALVVDQQYLLYPEIIDESFIRAARVEARMRRAQKRDACPDEVMSTFYIELNPSPTE